ncbi:MULTISPECIES: hypothetical protein [unclassified Streptomyces]|uniref:hypothetical protein n=1 Tax=unclassified Streptomyces TaxID=2593676 RepID=UPI0006AE3570|nr:MULTISPECIES: hypothetical protein [unclassified Streptomyces]KOX38292.1 hypothetical protein ADL06_01575 [Streptomyces sp. NRRL F-6491]KOX52445.1 hypothetical protein ADL08_01570 [Streptomyces sp. NRRL F-6492]
MPARALRPLAATLAATAAFGGLALAGAPAAFAAPGDNGDIKVHKVGTPYGDLNDEARVCRFYLAAFNFDILQEVSWEITPQPPRPEVPTLSGRVALATGMGHTNPLTLPEGQYRVTWTFPGATPAGKQKVFTVDCHGNGQGGRPGNGQNNGNNGNNGSGNNWSGNDNNWSGNGQGRPPQGPVGAGGGGSVELAASEGSSAFGIGATVAAGLAGTAGLVMIRRSRRRNDGAA